MPRVNLLPWRQQLRQQRVQKWRVILMIALGLLLLISVIGHVWLFRLIAHQQSRNQWLERANQDSELQIQQQKRVMNANQQLAAKIVELQSVKKHHAEEFFVFSELASLANKDILLRKCVLRGSVFNVDGKAKSNQALTRFLQALDDSVWFHEPRLSVIKQLAANTDAGDSGDFSLTVKIGKL